MKVLTYKPYCRPSWKREGDLSLTDFLFPNRMDDYIDIIGHDGPCVVHESSLTTLLIKILGS